ncbi:MAG: glycosyltransferase family 4 protein [Bacteroidota bacterium]|nr:glycosyltransferase family 4 protein [Bacteroidota bacterium]MDP4211053.1 glycosyltransferase family 4 protein [Bacteroidota bacterium]MDP4248725.1 glycosyltransferase family 4 protein [Bacteroidota bacterium]
MKVVLITRSTLLTVKGGDTIQVFQTAKHLARLGISADVKLTQEKINYSNYDLLHFFNITRPADILFHIQKAGKPFVITTILIDYSDFDKIYRKGISGFILRFLSADNAEYIKAMARFLKGQERLMTRSYVWMGQRKCIKEILTHAAMVFSNSHMESKKITQRYGLNTNCVAVSNGVDPEVFAYNEQIGKDETLVLCVGRIEGIKNQLNLIEALNNTKYKLLIIGSAAPNQPTYYRECRRTAASNVHFMDFVEQSELALYYQRAKVHVLASWFEACGLSSLEAAAMGCNIVITANGYTREYYEGYAFYCHPESPASILQAVNEAAVSGFPKKLREKILSVYTWPQAAARIAKAYHHIQHTYEHPHRNNRVKGYSQSLRRL